MPLNTGEPAPWFTAPTPSNPEFIFDSFGGRFVLLVFLPRDDTAGAAVALRALAQRQAMFNDHRLSAFIVVRDPATVATAKDLRGLRWFLDADGRVSRLYGALDSTGAENPLWLLLDPTLRVLQTAPLAEPDAMLATLAALPTPDEHAGVPLYAPILIAPRIFDPELCAQLIALHQADGGAFTGVMRDKGERTIAVMDVLKRRRDLLVSDPSLQGRLEDLIRQRLFPAIRQAMSFEATRIERYVISCYDAADRGVFHPHRDNTTYGTAHRKFACSINLNDDFEGGDLRFPEFGSRTYRPPIGGAVVFACGLLHEATRVTAGRRYAFLPFLYDEAGAEVLAAYEARVAATLPAL